MARKPHSEPDDDLTVQDAEDEGPPRRAAPSRVDDDHDFDIDPPGGDDDTPPPGDDDPPPADDDEVPPGDDDGEPAPRRRRWLSPLALNSYALVVLFAALIGTLAFTYTPPPPPPPPRGAEIAISLPPPPPAVAPGGAESSPGAPAVPGTTAPPPGAAPAVAAPSGTPARPAPPAPPRGSQAALAAALDPALVTEGPAGPLPVIAPEGRQAWQVYARPFAQDRKRPRVAIVVQGLGFGEAATTAAIQQLPGAVTLSFEPYAPEVQRSINAARAAGHEVFLQLPMEPLDYPASDPGPHTLLTSLRPDQNIDRLGWLLSRFTGYVGVITYMGDRFTASTEALTPVLQEARDSGLMLLDARTSRNSVAAQVAADLNMPRAVNNRFIDVEASRVGIDARLIELERIAQQTGTAVGIGTRPYPVTIERVAAWAATLDAKGIDLVPVSAIANRQAVR